MRNLIPINLKLLINSTDKIHFQFIRYFLLSESDHLRAVVGLVDYPNPPFKCNACHADALVPAPCQRNSKWCLCSGCQNAKMVLNECCWLDVLDGIVKGDHRN